MEQGLLPSRLLACSIGPIQMYYLKIRRLRLPETGSGGKREIKTNKLIESKAMATRAGGEEVTGAYCVRGQSVRLER